MSAGLNMLAPGEAEVSDISLLKDHIVTCGILEEGKNITLMYTIPDPKKSITWDWVEQKSGEGITTGYTAQMIAKESKRGHVSKPVPKDVFGKLGSKVQKTRENIYFKVTFSRKDDVSIEEYFNKS